MKGQIVQWNDAKGYGFISASGGELKAFVHISSFKHTATRPKLNDKVTFAVSRDNKGRYSATDVRFDGVNRLPVTVLFGLTFLVFVCLISVLFKGAWLLAALYLILSVFTYLMYAWDKQAAKSGSRRTSEKTLHMLSLIGGWPGALLAQNRLRHKSRKQPFKLILWLTVLINLGLFGWTFTIPGRDLVQYILSSIA
ncbi:DUF1294 domain-containing protein [Vibrio sp.]|uniref:DUF1294 domain-containing protein n=1 Tax=Vibrio sp. TaxID=678 RepID=UPI003D126B8E